MEKMLKFTLFEHYIYRKSFIVTIPEETQVHPAINRFYNRDAATGENYWSPLVSVDLTLQDVSLQLINRQLDMNFLWDFSKLLESHCQIFQESITAFEITVWLLELTNAFSSIFMK